MNTKYILGEFEKRYSGLTVEVLEDEEDHLRLVAKGCHVGDYDDDVTLRYDFYQSAIVFQAIFDHLELTMENYEALNRFNEENVFFTAYASEHAEGHIFLHVRGVVPSIESEEEGLMNVFFLMRQLVDEDTVTLLKPLTEATY